MKKYIIFFIVFFCGFISLNSAETSKNVIVDSLFTECNHKKNLSDKIIFLNNAFEQHLQDDWSISILSKLSELSNKSKEQANILNTQYLYIRYYQYRSDLSNYEKCFYQLKDLSYRFNDFDYYFTAWHSLLSLYMFSGNNEKAYLQIKHIKEEYEKCKSYKGEIVYYLCLGDYFSYNKDIKKAIKYYSKLISLKNINDRFKIIIYGKMADIYSNLKRYDECIKELKEQKKVLIKVINSVQDNKAAYKELLFGVEITLCEIYYMQSDIAHLEKQLAVTKKLFKEDRFVSFVIRYHIIWAKYYALLNNWDLSLNEYDNALAKYSSTQFTEQINLLREKGDMLMNAEIYKEAYKTYQNVAIKRDSVIIDIYSKNKEAHEENNEITNALLKSKEYENRFYIIGIFIVTSFLFFTMFVMLKLRIINNMLKDSRKEIKKEFDKEEEINKSKEDFLKNIDYNIRIPLNDVVGFSDLICSDNDLSKEEIKEYSLIIKKKSDLLIRLIFNILDYSRLEAGMMRFNIDVCNALKLCDDTKILLNLHNQKQEVLVSSQINEAYIETDSSKFIMMLTSLFSVPDGCKFDKKIECNIKIENNMLLMEIKGSPILYLYSDNQEYSLQNDINKLFIETFKGCYSVINESTGPTVVIKYPLKIR